MEEASWEEELEEVLERVHGWFRDFTGSGRFEELTEEQRDASEAVVMSFAEDMHIHHDLSPEEWDREGLRECCLETLPRRVAADVSFFRAVAPVLSAFLAFAAERGLLSSGPDLARAVRAIDRRIVRNAQDPRCWGPGKSFSMAALEAGVDITDQRELDPFLALYQMRQLAAMEAGVPPRRRKVGRNDPCPCGSGRRYKKCCGRRGR